MVPRPRLSGAALLALATACSGQEPAERCPQPAFGGDGTDEAWRTMVDGEDQGLTGDPSAPEVTSPTDGEVLANDVRPTFRWSSPIAALLPQHNAPEGLFEAVASLFEGIAHAHLPPVTGDVYYVRLTVPDRACQIRVLTTELEWQIDGESWLTLLEAEGRELSLDITSAYLTENRITEGPFKAAASRRFRVGR